MRKKEAASPFTRLHQVSGSYSCDSGPAGVLDESMEEHILENSEKYRS
jgi:hypothetical protein